MKNPTIDFLAKERNRLVEENRELLEALETIIDSARDGRSIPEWLDERLVEAEAAIRKVRNE